MAQDVLFTKIGIVEESAYGTTPASALQLINLNQFPQFTRPRNVSRPDVLTNDRRRYPTVILQEDGTLSLSTLLQYANSLLLMEGLMANDQATPVSISAATISVVGSTGVISDSGNGLGDLNDGDLFYMSGTLNGLNDGWKGPVTSAAVGEVTVPASQVVDESAGETIAIKTTRLLDANTPKSYSAEWQATALTDEFRGGVGYRVRSGSWRWQQGSFVEESYELMGQAPDRGTATIGTGAATAAVTNEFLNPVGDFGSIYISGASTSYIISSWELSAESALAPVYGLGSSGPSEISTGPLDVSLGASVIYDDNSQALLANIEAHDSLSVWWNVVDPAGNKIAFCLPAVKADAGDPGGGGPGSFLELQNVQFTGHDPARDPSSTHYADAFGYQFGIFMVAA